jgi:putative sterol carrier protein
VYGLTVFDGHNVPLFFFTLEPVIGRAKVRAILRHPGWELCNQMTNAQLRAIPAGRLRRSENISLGASAADNPQGPDIWQEGQFMSSDQVNQIISQMSSAIGTNSGLGGTLKFDFGEPGSVLVDGKSDPNSVSDGEGKSADCTITVSLETFEKMVKGELDGTSAFMQGKLRVAGDMGLAMKLGPILQKARG